MGYIMIYIYIKNVAGWKIPEQAMEVYSCKIIKLNGGLVDILVALNSISSLWVANWSITVVSWNPRTGFGRWFSDWFSLHFLGSGKETWSVNLHGCWFVLVIFNMIYQLKEHHGQTWLAGKSPSKIGIYIGHLSTRIEDFPGSNVWLPDGSVNCFP